MQKCVAPPGVTLADPTGRPGEVVSEELGTQWEQICGVASQQSRRVLNSIVDSYSDSSRRYHGLGHVLGVVARVNDLAKQPLWTDTAQAAADKNAAVVAAWYHDVIYDPRSGGNEAASATRATEELHQLGLAPLFVAQVSDLVLMTIEHRPDTAAGALLADSDLWTLGGPKADYFAYGRLIRQEYAHVPDPAWRMGRSAFIEVFLGRDQIFNTPRGQAEREAQARRNLRAELASLVK